MSLVRNLLNMFKGNAVLLTTRSRTNPLEAVPVTADDPLPITIINGSTGGGGSDPASAREATLGQVRDRLPVQPTTVLGRQILTLTNVAQPLTVPAGTLRATLGVRGGSASVALANPAPTATAGLLWPDGSSWALEAYELAALRGVIASGGSVLDVTYVGVPVASTAYTLSNSSAGSGSGVWVYALGAVPVPGSAPTVTRQGAGLTQQNPADAWQGENYWSYYNGSIYIKIAAGAEPGAITYTP